MRRTARRQTPAARASRKGTKDGAERPSQGHVEPGLTGGRSCGSHAARRKPVKDPIDLFAGQPAVDGQRKQGRQLLGVQQSKRHALTSDGADLMGGIADEYDPAMVHPVHQVAGSAEAAMHRVARRIQPMAGAPRHEDGRSPRSSFPTRATHLRTPPGSGNDSTIPSGCRKSAATGPKSVESA